MLPTGETSGGFPLTATLCHSNLPTLLLGACGMRLPCKRFRSVMGNVPTVGKLAGTHHTFYGSAQLLMATESAGTDVILMPASCPRQSGTASLLQWQLVLQGPFGGVTKVARLEAKMAP